MSMNSDSLVFQMYGIEIDADKWNMMKNYNISELKVKNESVAEITKD